MNEKVQGITERLRPMNLKDLRSYLGAVNQMNKFIPELASLCFAFRDILKKYADWKWTETHEKAFKEVNEKVKKITELKHFKRQNKFRILCDANRKGLGAVLEQIEEIANCWKPIAFASRFLTDFEEK